MSDTLTTPPQTTPPCGWLYWQGQLGGVSGGVGVVVVVWGVLLSRDVRYAQRAVTTDIHLSAHPTHVQTCHSDAEIRALLAANLHSFTEGRQIGLRQGGLLMSLNERN